MYCGIIGSVSGVRIVWGGLLSSKRVFEFGSSVFDSVIDRILCKSGLLSLAAAVHWIEWLVIK